MGMSRFTEEQIIGMTKEQETGLPTWEGRREYQLSSATFYKFKAKYGGMEVSDACKLKGLGRRMPSSSGCWQRPCSTMWRAPRQLERSKR